MGRDKAAVLLGGRTLLDHVLAGIPAHVPCVLVGPDPGRLPRAVTVLRPSGEAAALAALVPYTAEQRARDGRLTLYLCQGFACEAPTHELAPVVAKLTARPMAE